MSKLVCLEDQAWRSDDGIDVLPELPAAFLAVFLKLGLRPDRKFLDD